MQKIEFYYDPSCPWCWVTSRWLTEIKQHRNLDILWRPFSLAIKNNELVGGDSTGHLDTHNIGHKVHRIIESIVKNDDGERGHLYTEFGRAYFIDSTLDDDKFMSEVLNRLNLSQDYLQAANDSSFDKGITESMQNAFEVVGKDVGVPIIVFVNETGEKQGYFGPVLQGLPDLEEGLKLWDGLHNLASSSRFFELKRSRTGGSKVKTTKRLFTD